MTIDPIFSSNYFRVAGDSRGQRLAFLIGGRLATKFADVVRAALKSGVLLGTLKDFLVI